MPASKIWPHPCTINNPGGHVITIFVDPPSSSYLQKMGCHYLTPSLNILQSFVFPREKLHVIFCIVCTFMLHNLHRTYIPHYWYIIKQNAL